MAQKWSHKDISTYLVDHGLNPSLPTLIFSQSRECLGMSNRMEELLGLHKDKALSIAELERHWPFFTEFESAQAVFLRLLGEAFEQQPWGLICEARLKSYRLTAFPMPMPKKSKERILLVQAELLRAGDLLEDEASRQTLFRALSHEIRSSVMALQGFLGILKEADSAEMKEQVIHRMDKTLNRLDKVVERLNDFKTELKVLDASDDSSVKASAKKGSKARG